MGEVEVGAGRSSSTIVLESDLEGVLTEPDRLLVAAAGPQDQMLRVQRL
jgi:hypothetical protein